MKKESTKHLWIKKTKQNIRPLVSVVILKRPLATLCMCLCVCVHVRAYVCVTLYGDTCANAHEGVCTCVSVYVHVCVCVRAHGCGVGIPSPSRSSHMLLLEPAPPRGHLPPCSCRRWRWCQTGSDTAHWRCSACQAACAGGALRAGSWGP